MRTLEELVKETRTAVIVVDVQNDYCHPDGALPLSGCDLSGVKSMMPNLQELLTQARANAVPIIFIQTFHEKATDSEAWVTRSSGRSSAVCRTGSWGAQFYEVCPEKEDVIVNKHRYSAFVNTRLDSVLHTLKVETLVMTGVSTNVCVESTARDGFMRDYNIVLVHDACASYSQKAHDMTVENIEGYFGKAATTPELIRCWEQSGHHSAEVLRPAQPAVS
ncbi:cysteine hydrolase [Paenibacillus sp. F411]|uniref:Isochorismatase hydrolase n=1 Tax=Paenibacillus algicola TaxID=2565926 RepID=A0A4P8XNG7_9BACL|nr:MULTISPECIES: isochorismatase family cysteine hydrolase [Paenibacillus]MBO2944039.1 cysteine hydrolase [Paenibacillus sp. F411]QCT01859.1 isochorismatase hydrolase [Paenibacillus algicola]